MKKKTLFFFAVLCTCFFPVLAYAAPAITVSATAVTLLGTGQSISIQVNLIDPNATGMLRVSGTGIVPIMTASTVTPGTTATVGPIYSNDVIIDGFGNLNGTYYKVQVFTVTNGIIASTPSFLNYYAFQGSGTVDLATATPLAPSFLTGTAGSVSMPGSLSVTGTITGSSTLTVGTTFKAGDGFGGVNTAGINGIIYADQKCTTPGTFDQTCLANAFTAAGSNGRVVIPPHTYTISSQVSITQNVLDISAYGAIFVCALANNCISLNGGVTNQRDVTWRGGTFQPGTGMCTNTQTVAQCTGWSAFQDNIQHFVVYDVQFQRNPNLSTLTFEHAFEIDNDQAFVLKHFEGNIEGNGGNGWIRCSATANDCGSAVWNPGPFSVNAGVGWIEDSDFSMKNQGNGIDWQGGNTLVVRGGVVQGFNQYAIRYHASSSSPPYCCSLVIDHVYRANGSPVNPIGNVGTADIIAQGSVNVSLIGGVWGPIEPTFTTNGTPGSTIYWYYIVANDGTFGKSSPMAIGSLTTGNATLSAGNSVNVAWPAIPHIASSSGTYDLLRITFVVNGIVGNLRQGPFGTQSIAVATGLTPGANCTATLCTFTDTVPTASLSSYTVPTNNSYNPALPYWPGALVLSAGADAQGGLMPRYNGPNPGGVGGITIDAQPVDTIPNVWFVGGNYDFQSDNIPYSPVRDTSLGTQMTFSGGTNMAGMLLPQSLDFQNNQNNVKGAINFGGVALQSFPIDVLTLHDSNYTKTIATQNHRPSNDANDAAICQDATTNICWRAQSNTTEYIGAVNDASSWKRKLTATQELLAVAPVPSVAGAEDLGATLLPFGNLWLGTAATNNFKFAPAATAAARVISVPDPLAATSLGLSYNATNPVYQTKRGVAGCTTGAAAGNSCGTDITVTWGTAFPDANYSVTCTGSAPTNVPSGPFVTSGTKLAATVHINYFAITAAAASYATIDCIAVHD